MATKTRRLADLLANIDDNSKVTSAGLLDATITATDLAPNSVDSSELVDGAVDTSHIGDLQVTAGKIAANAVTTAKILDANITSAKVDNAVFTDNIEVKPHIKPGTLHPAWRGLLTDNTGFTFTDSSSTGHALTPAGTSLVSHSGAEKKVGSTSLYFDGFNGDYFTIPDHTEFAFGTGNFTIEFFVNCGVQAAYTTIFSAMNHNVRITLGPDATTVPKLSFYTDTWGAHTSGTSNIGNGAWHHCAVVRQGTDLKLYVDGALEATRASSGNSLDPDIIRVGQYVNTTLFYKGYLDEIRIVKGKAVYTGAFTPPTALTATGGTYSSATNVVNPTASETSLLIHSDNGGHSGAYGTAQSDGLSYYYTDIKGSEPIKDPRIGAHFGSQRHKFKTLQKLEQESASNTQSVFSIDGRKWARAVGSSQSMINDVNGNYIRFDGNPTTHYYEFVCYCSSLNMILECAPSNRHAEVSIDGGSETSFDTAETTQNSPLKSRYVDAGTLFDVVTGQTLGIHTIKIRTEDGSDRVQIYGIEPVVQDIQNFTATNATNTLTSTGHTLSNGDQIRLVGSDLPNGLSATTTYFVIGASGNNFQVATTSTGSAVTFSDDGTGSRTFKSLNTLQIPAQNVVSYGKKFSVSATAQHYNPFAVAADNTTAVAIGNAGSHGKVATGWSGTTAGHFDSTLDTATSLGLDAWVTGGNYYRPVNGGRIIKWIDSTGAIKTSVNMMPPTGTANGSESKSDATLPTSHAWTTVFAPKLSSASVDYSQAEVSKTYHWREFGNGNANAGADTGSNQDFSMFGSGARDLAFVMDDGLTSMSYRYAYRSAETHLRPNNGGATLEGPYITFIGTGFTIKDLDDNYRSAQNLPYGSHIIRFRKPSGESLGEVLIDGIKIHDGSFNSMMIQDYITFHQPKKPPIPEDAVVLADYMLMADFVPVSGSGLNLSLSLSKGTRYADPSRDFFWDSGASFSAMAEYRGHFVGGFRTETTSAAAVGRLPFFGTNSVECGYVSRFTSFLNGSASANPTTVASSNTWETSITHDGAALGSNYIELQDGSNNFNVNMCYIVSPIHTSSHYQSFETPFLNELVGGDRNMEQTNLVVTADGKTWDEATRDTSYIGNIACRVTTDTEFNGGSAVIFDEYRGSYNNLRHHFTKDFVPAYNRMYCIRDGWYQMSVLSYDDGTEHLRIYVNNAYLVTSYNTDSGQHNMAMTYSHYFKKGDYFYLTGAYGKDGIVYSNFEIIRLD